MKQLKYYYAFFIFNGISLAVAANPLFFDKIMLEMKIDLSAFGWIKGLSFFIGVFICMLISHLLQQLSREREVVIVGYAIRIMLPALLIVSPLFFNSKSALAYIALICMTMCYFVAMAANNSLNVLLKRISPAESLSKNTGYAMSLNRLSCGAFALLMAWALSMLEKDHSFIFAYCTLLLICGVFHIPASISLLKIKNTQPGTGYKPRILDLFIPVKDKDYIRALGITLGAYGFFGACSAYLFAYFMKVIEIKFSYLAAFDLLISAAAIYLSGKWGKYYDKYGHRRILNIIVCGIMSAVFFLFPHNIITALIFSLMVWTGMSGLFGAGLGVVQRSLSIQKSCPMRTNIYIASASLFGGIGFMLGNLGASMMFSTARQLYPSVKNINAYHGVFIFMFIPCLVILIFNNFKFRQKEGNKPTEI